MRLIQIVLLLSILASCGHNKIRYSHKRHFEQKEVSQTENVKTDPQEITIQSEVNQVKSNDKEQRQTTNTEEEQPDNNPVKQIKTKTKSSERIRAEEIAEQIKEKLNLDSDEAVAKKQGTTLLIIGIVLFLLAMGAFAYVLSENSTSTSDVGGCIESLIIIFIYGFLLIGAGIAGLVLTTMGIIILSTGKAIGGRSGSRTKRETNPNDREAEKGQRTYVTVRIIVALVALLGAIIILATL